MKIIDRLFGLNRKDPEVMDEPVPESEAPLRRWDGDGVLPLSLKKWLEPFTTTPEQASEIESMESFSDLIRARLGVGEYVVLNDMNTVGAVFEVDPMVTDARSEEFMQDVLHKINGILREAIPRDIQSPWMMNVTLQDENTIEEFKGVFDEYGDLKEGNQAFREEWLRILKEHLDDVADPDGLFVDTMVSGGSWYARFRRIRLYLWRVVPNVKKDHGAPLSDVVSQLQSRFNASGLGLKQKDSNELYAWLTRFFLPAGKEYLGMDTHLDPDKKRDAELGLTGVFQDGAGGDIARSALHGTRPYSDENGNWFLTGKPVRFISVQEPESVPAIGHISAERKNGEQQFALWDRMPTGSIWSQTIIFESDEVIQEELDRLEGATLGDDEKSKLTKEMIIQARQQIAQGNIVLKSFMGVYVIGDDIKDLDTRVRETATWLDASGLKVVPPKMDYIAQDCFIRALPFNFDPDLDKKPAIRRARKYFCGDLARLIPFYGRSKGTGNPGYLFFNRGGEPFTFDPLKDRIKNAFSLILGPTGSGKSALLNYLIAQYVAFYNARFFIIEKGKSFYLLGKFLQKFGVTVNQITVTPNNPVSLNPFNDACKLPEVLEAIEPDDGYFEERGDLLEKYRTDDESDDGLDDDQRDVLGEMMLAAITMITGGETKELELLRRHERFDVMLGIIEAGKATVEKGYTLPEDVSIAFQKMSEDTEKYSEKRRERLLEFSANMELFCTGVRGKFFNRPGEPWPDADVTIFDVGMLINPEYADMLGVSVVSMLNRVISIAEGDQYNLRPTICLADEGHLTTTNPLIAPIVTNMTKMARKLGLWFWLATQNLKDFKDDSSKMLSNFEWWITMSTTKDEVGQISRFRSLTKDEELLLLAARKEKGKYTEGVVMSDNLLSLFRNVPPALAMALAQTDGDEKAERRLVMEEHGVDELEAAYIIAERMQKMRKVA